MKSRNIHIQNALLLRTLPERDAITVHIHPTLPVVERVNTIQEMYKKVLANFSILLLIAEGVAL
jgi:hypothetical protein